MVKLILIACIVCCIAYLSPTRERAEVEAQVGAAVAGMGVGLGVGLGDLAALASSPQVLSPQVLSGNVLTGLGQRAMADALRRPHAPVSPAQPERVANTPERPYR